MITLYIIHFFFIIILTGIFFNFQKFRMFYTRQNFPVCRWLNVQSCKLIKKIKYLKRIKK